MYVTAQYHPFDLIDDVAHGTVLGKRTDVRPMKVGDQVVFKSAAGEVNVKLAPADVFGVCEFHAGDQPLQVKKLAKFQYWCGVVAGGKPIGWPMNADFGNKDDTVTPS